MIFDLFPDKTNLHKVFLILQVQVMVKFVFFQVHVSDEAFLVLIVTFLENFYFLYSPIQLMS